jgi:hypothetical protein
MSITKPVPGSINAPLGSQQESGVNAFGGVNIAEATGLSSDVTTTATNLFTVTGGDVSIENILLSTDSTGFAGATAIAFLTDDPVGLETFFEDAVSNLGANASVDFFTAGTVVTQRRIIHQGYHLQIKATGANATGSGVWGAYIQYRPCVQVAVMQ